MGSSEHMDDDFVADSEDEYGEPGQPNKWNGGNPDLLKTVKLLARAFGTAPETPMSHISYFSGDGNAPAKALSSIAQFTETPTTNALMTSILASSSSKGSDASPAASKPRPKPRPVAPKIKQVDSMVQEGGQSSFNFLDHAIAAGTSAKLVTPAYLADFDIDEFPGMSSIADRAKTRQRNPTRDRIGNSDPILTGSTESRNKGKEKALILSSDVIELSSDDEDDELNLKISKSTKSKLKSSTKAKVTNKTTHSDPIATSSATNQPKPRPRPRPIPKKTNISPSDQYTTSPPDSRLTSDQPAGVPPRPRSIPSSLPPSDLSFHTSYPATDVYDHPPIETLANPRSELDLDHEGTSSSPSSSLDRIGRGGKSAIDELFSGDDEDEPLASPLRHVANLGVGPPPPTFFAGSSSLDRNIEMDMSISHGAPPAPAPEVVDLTMFLTEPQPRIGVTLVSKPLKVKKKGSSEKKKQRSQKDLDEGDWGVDDDSGGDWEEEASKKKKKTKAKLTEKSSKKAKDASSPAARQVEVVITTLPIAREGSKKGGNKGETKAKSKGKGKDKEEFKSKEFINDSDDEADLFGLAPSTAGVASTHNSSSASGSGVKHTSQTNVPRPKRPPTPARDPSLEPLSPPPEYMVARDAVRPSSTSNKKKRKSVGEGESEDVAGSPSKKRKQSKEKKGKVKAKDSAVADLDVDMNMDGGVPVSEEVVVSRRGEGRDNGSLKSKAKKTKAKGVVLSEDEDELEILEAESSSPKINAPLVSDSVNRRKKKTNKNDVVDEDEDSGFSPNKMDKTANENFEKVGAEVLKENIEPPNRNANVSYASSSALNTPQHVPLYKRYSIAPRTKSTPMTELIKRVNSLPSSPFPAAHASRSMIKGTAYSPYLKSSRSALSRIAPLHPNRRTPPPPLPPPPPKKKTKKELEREEQWEEELVESVGGSEEWALLSDAQRSGLRKMKKEREMSGWED